MQLTLQSSLQNRRYIYASLISGSVKPRRKRHISPHGAHIILTAVF
nr:MAG TPA: hypothetical protein [Caudoviricetes sp.]